MDADPEDVLFRQQYVGWTLWFRQNDYRSYKNVYAVLLVRNGQRCSQQVHRVRGALGNGPYFAGFLIKSQTRKHSLAAISDKFASGLTTEASGGHWVIVEAESPEAAADHSDVRIVRDDLMQDGVGHVFCGVYFISNGRGAIKIGHTAANVRTRLAQLQGASPYRLKVCAVIDTADQKRIEKQLHCEHKHRRLEGEWFEMTEAEAVAIAVSLGGRTACVRMPSTHTIPKCRA
jgi:hypothetical protein